jgi:hypothetical protein
MKLTDNSVILSMLLVKAGMPMRTHALGSSGTHVVACVSYALHMRYCLACCVVLLCLESKEETQTLIACSKLAPLPRALLHTTRLPIDPITVGRRWGQRHPQGANSGSIGAIGYNDAAFSKNLRAREHL